MVHGIAQLAIFGNGLFGLCIWILPGRLMMRACAIGMLVSIYHILPRNKAEEQHPCKDNMIFISVHSQ